MMCMQETQQCRERPPYQRLQQKWDCCLMHWTWSDCDNSTLKWAQENVCVKRCLSELHTCTTFTAYTCIHVGILLALLDLILDRCREISAFVQALPLGIIKEFFHSDSFLLCPSQEHNNYIIDICFSPVHFCDVCLLWLSFWIQPIEYSPLENKPLPKQFWDNVSLERYDSQAKPQRHSGQVESHICCINWAHRQWQALVLLLKLTVWAGVHRRSKALLLKQNLSLCHIKSDTD